LQIIDKDTRHDQEILGHIYIISLEKQYVTKFAYQTTGEVGQPKGKWDVRTIDPRQVIRKYYTNSLGEFRSADILPRAYGAAYTENVESLPIVWAGMYIETAYRNEDSRLGTAKVQKILYERDTDGRAVAGSVQYKPNVFTDMDVILDADEAVKFYALVNNPRPVFPPFKWMPVESEFRSKFFTANAETMLKRIRKGLFNVFSKGEINVRLIAFHEAGYDDRSEHYSELLQQALQNFFYPPTVDNYNEYDNLVVLGTNSNILSFVPASDQSQLLDLIEDRYGKAVRFGVEIRTKYRTQLNSFVLHWRPIHTYLQ
jgi:hypothetical protein